MIQPGTLPLSGGRFVPFTYEIDVRGMDLTGAALLAHVRLYKNAGGSPLVNLSQVNSAASEGVRLISVGVAGGFTTSKIGIRINETTMEGLPLSSTDPLKLHAQKPDVVLAWDMHVTPAGGLKFVLLEGSFTVKGGVTQ